MRRPVKGQYRLPIPIYLFRRRADENFPPYTPSEEIETEQTLGLYFRTEGSTIASPIFIITE
tara:strand:- start:80 stop:265 length:186 start_codon:yes stop_codon:yes gene_type:complete